MAHLAGDALALLPPLGLRGAAQLEPRRLLRRHVREGAAL